MYKCNKIQYGKYGAASKLKFNSIVLQSVQIPQKKHCQKKNSVISFEVGHATNTNHWMAVFPHCNHKPLLLSTDKHF